MGDILDKCPNGCNADCKIKASIDIQDGHFKIQDGGQVSCQYQFHTDPCNVKCICANLVHLL